MRQFMLFLLVCLGSFFSAYAQQNLAEKLGYPKDAKLLILHADDAGLSHSVNAATIAAFEKKGITSASIQVPCAWFPEIAAYAKAHPEMDWGVHITLTSEWKNYKWGGVLPADKIPSLLDSNGHFYSSVQEFAKHAKPMEVEAEMRAQIKRALSFGIKITHLDCHMGAVYSNPELANIYYNVSKEFGIPAFQMKNMPGIAVDKNTVVVDALYLAYKAAPAQEWNNYYNNIIQQLRPGLNELILHLAFDNDEMKAVTIEHPDFGSAWRQNDLNFVTSESLQSTLKKNNVVLVSWGDIQRTLQKK